MTPDRIYTDHGPIIRSEQPRLSTQVTPTIRLAVFEAFVRTGPKCFEIDGGGPKALITDHFAPTRISPSPSNLLQNQNPIKCFEIDGGGPKALITGHFVPTRISPSPSNFLQNQNPIKNLCLIGQICCARAIGVSMFDEAFLKILSNYITCLS